MITCPKCGELNGNDRDRCFKCNAFLNGSFKIGSAAPAAPRTVQKANRICPNCKKVYYSVAYEECPNCHVPMPLYSVEAKIKAQQEDFRLSMPSYARAEERAIKKFDLLDIDPKDAESVRYVSAELYGSGFLETLSTFSHKTNTSDYVMMRALRALIDQNWIIIRQLDRLNKSLDKIESKEENANADL